MYCKRCGCEQDALLKKDSRGVVDAYCCQCGAYIKKVSSAELLDLLNETNAAAKANIGEAKKVAVSDEKRPPCRYCAERFFYQYGRMGVIYKPLDDAKFCPMCGRELDGHERDY